MFRTTGKRLFALLVILGIAITVLVGRKRPQVATQVAGAGDFQHPDRSVPWWATLGSLVDRWIGWERLPLPLGLAVLYCVRTVMRAKNLYDTSVLPTIPQPEPQAEGTSYLTARTTDGTFNDVQYPSMGSARTRFGRLIPLEETYPDPEPAILEPSPRTVSRELLGRSDFIPAESLNMLAAAWIQFMIRDWLSHGTSPKENPWLIPIAPDDDWWQRPMQIMRTPPDPTRPPGTENAPPTHINTETHWWDGSQIYGSSAQVQKQVRSGQDGKLILTPDGLPPDPLLAQLAQQPGWWIGLAMMSTLFAREHNAICDHLKAEFPTWSDDELFDRARLINVGLMAKIHTVEWTPAIISHPTTQMAMRDEWWGLQGEQLSNLFGRLSDTELISGTTGSATNQFTAPYAHTEEFVAVYRMHPLIPDDFSFRAAVDDHLIEERQFYEVTDRGANALLEQTSLADLFYSFGTSNPGALTLHNYPRYLQKFKRPDGIVIDLAATDILRMRELGVPRYNQFRRLLHLNPVRSFEELVPAEHPEWAEEIRRIYNNDIERVDLMVGLFAEPKPQGFGFSNTAFHVFILTAPRRLKSDRFFTDDFTPEIYTQTGLKWIANNSMTSVLLRHFPGLRPALRDHPNAFVPWTRTGPYKPYSTAWKEVFFGGSEQAEAKLFATFTDQIKRVQQQIKEREHAPVIRRAFHAKIHAGITQHIGIANAEFRVLPDIPADLQIGLFQPNTTYQAIVRFSNASGAIQPDATKDLRGVALRVVTDQGKVQDFLMTDAPASHARDARQFMVAAEAMASPWQIATVLKLLSGLGLAETWRMIQALSKDARKIDSLVTDQFWSRAPIKFGPYAMKFTLQPAESVSRGSAASGENYLKEDFIQRLQKGPITFDFRVQGYVDEVKTPIEDGTVEWKESDAPFKTIAQLVIPQQDLRTASAMEAEALVDKLDFNPWNTTEEFRPLGNLNRARRTVYQASADYRAGGPGPSR